MSVIALFLIISMLIVLWFDGTSYLIPNWLVGLMFIAYPVAVYMARINVNWKMALAGAAIVLAVGFIIFARKIMGGGDIKLLTACALWVGYDNLMDFLFAVALFGGIFAIGVWLIRKALPFILKEQYKVRPLPRILRHGEPVPYGVAIAFGFLLMMGTGKIPVLL